MLNRQSFKNVTIPLVPGEMKVTDIDQRAFVLARRGEKLRRRFWFSEGEDVPRFHDAIFAIVGEPSKAATTGTPGGSPPATDGFAKLFAGLNLPPSSGGGRTVTPPAPPVAAPITAGQSSSLANLFGNLPSAQQPRFSTPPPSALSSRTPVRSPAPPQPTQSPATVPRIAAPEPRSPPPGVPGQTADDLLANLLGAAPRLPPPAVAQSQTLVLSPNEHSAPHANPSPAPNGPFQPSQVFGPPREVPHLDASFAPHPPRPTSNGPPLAHILGDHLAPHTGATSKSALLQEIAYRIHVCLARTQRSDHSTTKSSKKRSGGLSSRDVTLRVDHDASLSQNAGFLFPPYPAVS